MISRESIEQFLVTNGVAPSAPDEEIKSLLLKANWHKDQVDTAITVLRENAKHEQRTAVVKKVFSTDEKMNPEMVSELLGITMDVSHVASGSNKRAYQPSLTVGTMLSIVLISVGAASILLLMLMYHLEIGLFHQTNAFYKYK